MRVLSQFTDGDSESGNNFKDLGQWGAEVKHVESNELRDFELSSSF